MHCVVKPAVTTHVTKILLPLSSRASRGLIVTDATNQQVSVAHSFRIYKARFSHERENPIFRVVL
jgi:hypothetical protein